MITVDQGRSAADIGSSLTGEEVDRLRQAVHWVRSHHGLRVKELAQNCDADIHTIHNFVAGKSQRPNSAFLGRLYCYLRTHQWLLPEGHFGEAGAPAGPPRPAAPAMARRTLGYGDVRGILPIHAGDIDRVRERYCCRYLCFARSYISPASILVAWLDIRAPRPGPDGPRLPRFTLFIKYPDRVDPTIAYSYVILGAAISREGLIYLVGHHDGGLRALTLVEPIVPKFKYLQGVGLLASVYDRQPFATRVVCQRLAPGARRRDWLDRLGVFDEDALRSRFDIAETVLLNLAGTTVLTACSP